MFLLLTTVAPLLLVTGCGSSSKSSSGPKSNAALSESAFIAEAQAVTCPLNGKIEALPKPSGLGELTSYAEQAGSLLNEARSKLAALVPPANKRAAFTKGLSAIDEGIKEIDEVAQAARAGDTQRVQALGGQLTSLGSRFQSIGRELGGGECPGGSGATSTTTSETPNSSATETSSTSSETTTPPSTEGAAQSYGAWNAEKTKGLELLLEDYSNRNCVIRYVEEHESPPGSSLKAEELAKQGAPSCGSERKE